MQLTPLLLGHHKGKAEKLKQSLPPDLAVKELNWTTSTDLNCMKIFKILKKQKPTLQILVSVDQARPDLLSPRPWGGPGNLF